MIAIFPANPQRAGYVATWPPIFDQRPEIGQIADVSGARLKRAIVEVPLSDTGYEPLLAAN